MPKIEYVRQKIDRQSVIKSWLQILQNPQKFEDFDADQSRDSGSIGKHETRQTRNEDKEKKTERKSDTQTVNSTDRQTHMQ